MPIEKEIDKLWEKEQDFVIEMTIRIENGADKTVDGIPAQVACKDEIEAIAERYLATTMADTVVTDIKVIK